MSASGAGNGRAFDAAVRIQELGPDTAEGIALRKAVSAVEYYEREVAKDEGKVAAAEAYADRVAGEAEAKVAEARAITSQLAADLDAARDHLASFGGN